MIQKVIAVASYVAEASRTERRIDGGGGPAPLACFDQQGVNMHTMLHGL